MNEPCEIAPGFRYGWAVAAWIAGWTLFRLYFCTTFELSGDEAYYWLWSKHLDWNYYSKGPGVAVVIWLGTRLLGDTVLGVRLGAVLLGAGTTACVYGLARRLFSPRVGFWTVVIATFAPLFVIGGVLMTIDPISVCFWSAAMWAFWEAAQRGRLAWWFLTGLFVALGMLGKYTNVALLPSFLLFALWDRDARRCLRGPGFWLMTAVALLGLLPSLWWNAQHGWVTAGHLVHRGELDSGLSLSLIKPLRFLGEQMGMAWPWCFIAICFAIFTRDLRQSSAPAWRFLVSLAAPLFLFYFVLSFHSFGPPNWTAPAYIGAFILMTAWLLPRLAARAGARRAALWIGGVSVALILAVFAVMPFRLPTRQDPFVRVRGSADLAVQARAFRTEQAATFMIAGNYQDASLLSFYMGEPGNVFLPPETGVHHQFSLWPGYGADGARRGQNAVMILRDDKPPEAVRAGFESVSPPFETWTRFKGHPSRRYYFFLCRNYLRP